MSETAPEIQSYKPRDIAQRLKAYICRAASLAQDYLEVPLVPAQAGISTSHDDPDSRLSGNERGEEAALSTTHREAPGLVRGEAGGQTSEVSPERVPCEPTGSREQTKMIQFRYHTSMMEHVKRLEYVLRCFILFLAGELIALGRVTASVPRRTTETSGKTLAQKQDGALRDQLRDLPRLNSFTVLTPVIKGKGREQSRTRSYTFLPDSLRLVDAGHILARFKRLSSVLTRADQMAMSLAARAVRSSLIPAQAGISQTSDVPDSRLRGNERKNPLYFEPLAHFCPPEALWGSADDEAERGDVNVINYMAASKLEEIGYGIRPDPHAGLPDLSCVDPPDPPKVCSL